MSKPRLILHIGYPKTGTTSLQQHFGALPGGEVFYPRTGLGRFGAHHGFAWPVIGFRLPWSMPHPPFDVMLEQLAREVDDRAPQATLLSSEFLILVTDEGMPQLARLGEHFDVTVLAYVRPQDSYLESLYRQWVCSLPHPYIGTIDEFFEVQREQLNYGACLRRFEAAFGRGKVVVRPFERAQWAGRDLQTDFYAAIAIEPPAAPVAAVAASPAVANPTRGVFVTEFIRQMALYGLAEPGRLFHWCSQRLDWPDDATLSYLSPDLRRRIAEDYRAGNEQLAREFMHRDDGQLFVRPLGSAGDGSEADVQHFQGLPEAMWREAAGKLWDDFQQQRSRRLRSRVWRAVRPAFDAWTRFRERRGR